MEWRAFRGTHVGAVVDWEGAAIEGGSPLEAIIGKEVFYLHDRLPMGVVAEVIRNDMTEPLGIVVYDESSKEVQRFRESQIEVRDDGRVIVLPSWFRQSRLKVLGRMEEMESVVPVIRKARARGKALPPEEAAAAIARAPYDVQRYVDEAVVLRSELIGKLHDLARRQAESRTELTRTQSPGLFDRVSEEERKAAVAKLRRSLRLNDLTIFAVKDFLLKMETSALFPRDPRARAMFKEEELRTAAAAASQGQAGEAPDGDVAEFEALPEASFEEEPFEVLGEDEAVEEFAPFEGEGTPYYQPPPPPPPPPLSQQQAPPQQSPTSSPPMPAPPLAQQPPGGPQPAFMDIEALPDEDDATVRRVTLEEMAWRPPGPAGYDVPPPPPSFQPYGVPPPPPSPPPPPPPMPRLEGPAQGMPTGPRMDVKRKEKEKRGFGIKGMFGRGRPARPEPPAPQRPPGTAQAAVPGTSTSMEDFETVDEEVAEFEAATDAPSEAPRWGEPMPIQTFQAGYGQPVYGAPMPPPSSPPPPPPPPPAMPPPPSLPPAPQAPPVRAYAPARRPEDLDSIEEVRAAFGGAPVQPEVVEEFAPVDEEVAEFEPEAEPVPTQGPAEEDRPLHAEKDIDKILAMALGKSAPPKTRPTARPGVREDLSSPISTLMSKTKYKPK